MYIYIYDIIFIQIYCIYINMNRYTMILVVHIKEQKPITIHGLDLQGSSHSGSPKWAH